LQISKGFDAPTQVANLKHSLESGLIESGTIFIVHDAGLRGTMATRSES